MSSRRKLPVWRVLGHEGFRLFFPLSALHMALWPFLWVAVSGLDLPFAHVTSPALWHAHEMIIGGFGAALLGFLTTAVPEWTDQEPMRGQPLFVLTALWGVARVIGLLGWDALAGVAGLADLAWIGALLIYALRISLQRQTDRLVAFMFWLVVLVGVEALARLGMVQGDYDLTVKGVWGTGIAFLGFLAIALGRITVPVTNLVLDPSEESSPFRPHPGRMNLAAGLVSVALAGWLWGLSDKVQAYLFIAAGAGFLDRVAEHFVGRAFWRAEILVLAMASVCAGGGLMLLGLSFLGADFGPLAGLHLAMMGGLGIGAIAVFAIAGLMHSNRTLPFPTPMRAILSFAALSVVLRVGPELGGVSHPFGMPYLAASILWGGALLAWLWLYWPYLTDEESLEKHTC